MLGNYNGYCMVAEVGPAELKWRLSTMVYPCLFRTICVIPDSKVHVVNMGPIWGRQDPGGPHVGPMNFAIWDVPYVFVDTTEVDKTNFKWTPFFFSDVYLLIYFETSLCTKHILMDYNNYIVIWFKDWPKKLPSWHIKNRTRYRSICISHELADVLGTGFWSVEPYFKEAYTMCITCFKLPIDHHWVLRTSSNTCITTLAHKLGRKVFESCAQQSDYSGRLGESTAHNIHANPL